MIEVTIQQIGIWCTWSEATYIKLHDTDIPLDVSHISPMASTTSRPNSEAVSAPPVFSYAQAAKGRAAATTASAIQSHQSSTSGVSTPAKDTASVANTPAGGSERGEKSVNGSTGAASRQDPSAEIAVPEWRTAAPKSASIPTSPSFGTASTSTLPKEDKDDDFVLVGVTASEARERNNAANTSSERPGENTEGRRSKKGKKQRNTERDAEKEKEKEREKEEVKQEILVPAPLPTINFWQQRKEELAKVKPAPVSNQNSQSIPESSGANGDASASVPKAVDAKKRGTEADKTVGSLPNGVVKDSPNSGKNQKKSGEGTAKPKEDQTGKRVGPRGSRTVEKDENVPGNQLPPPVEDSTSWPTPETALEEEKRKAQEKLEKEEKDETASNKPRPKEKWVPVPYTPSVTFNTPIPTRGGRGRGGARGGRTETGGRPGHSNVGAVGEKTPATPSTTTTQLESERQVGKDGTRSSSLPPSRRQPNDQPGARKPSNAQAAEKNKTPPSKGDSSNSTDIRNHLMPQTDQISEGIQENRESSRELKNEQMQNRENQHHTQLRSSIDRSSEQNLRGTEQFKDGANFNKDANHQSRERVEGRADRGRGGFRGRGNHASYPNGQPHPQHIFTNGHGPQQSNNYPLRQSTGPYSPPLQPPFNNQYMPSPSRGGRGGSRSQSIPNSGIYGRFSANGGPVLQHMAPLQTSGQIYDYHQPLQTMSAHPYNPYIDHTSVLTLVTMQLEYYFSIDNLCKDVYLRKHMDAQGFVFLNFIAGFKRIQALTQEFDLLRQACQESEIIEIGRGPDGADRLRRREGWEKWVLAIEERDESVRNDGPAYINHLSPVAQRSQHIIPSHQSMSPTPYTPNGTGTDPSFQAYSNGAGPQNSTQFNGNGNHYPSDASLSANAPDFVAGQIPLNGAPDLLDAETTFSNDEVANLTLVFLPKGNKDGSKPKSSFHTASRTFSNGSIDSRSIAEELFDDLRQGRTLSNGSHGET